MQLTFHQHVVVLLSELQDRLKDDCCEDIFLLVFTDRFVALGSSYKENRTVVDCL